MSVANPFATGAPDPWCPGCGHTAVVRALLEALARSYRPQDVVLVTDIGCIGMADAQFSCHTVHGLHGRGPALAAGIAITRPRPEMKVVALMGDGGAAIGLQHLMECARLNAEMTLVVCNNQNYGMTGGQHSAYTMQGVKTVTTPEGMAQSPFALCEMLAPLGVMRSRLLATSKKLADVLAASLAHRGFALVETMNYCPSYSGKMNPDRLTPRAMEDFFSAQGLAFGTFPATTTAPPFNFVATPRSRPPQVTPLLHGNALAGQVRILLAGSAGEGVQSAAEVFAQAALRSGLEAVVRGEYPVTVGKGFSAAYLLLSAEPVLSPAGETWDFALVTSGDGLRFARPRLPQTRTVVLDSSLAPPAGEEVAAASAPASVEQVDFRRHGSRSAAFAALVWALEREGWFPLEALREAVNELPSPKARDSLLAVLEKGLEGQPPEPSTISTRT